jgi:hypothetical protein
MNPLQYWTPEAIDKPFYETPLKERANKTYTTSGNDNTNLCTYTYNELGFRGDSIKKEGFKVMSLGCSITEGVGVNDEETWPAQFCSHIKNGVNFNFGTGGKSNDFICRCLITYYDLIKPDLVLIRYTFPHRREMYTEDGKVESYMPTKVLLKNLNPTLIQKSMDILQNDNADFINWYKNHMLIKLFLESKKCNWIWDGRNLKTNYTEFNRFSMLDTFNMDLASDKMHPGPLTHKYYGRVLYDYISIKHKSYFPFIDKIETKLI